MLRPIAVGNDTFVKWSQGQLENKKYFILQFSINHTHPHPAQLLNGSLQGTLTSVEEKADQVRHHLTEIQPLNQSAAATVLRNVEHEDNVVDDTLELEDDIFSLVVDASVTGILLQRFTRIKMRVLIITTENEFLGQDFRYVQWKIVSRLYCRGLICHFSRTPSEYRLYYGSNKFYPCRSRMALRSSQICPFVWSPVSLGLWPLSFWIASMRLACWSATRRYKHKCHYPVRIQSVRIEILPTRCCWSQVLSQTLGTICISTTARRVFSMAT